MTKITLLASFIERNELDVALEQIAERAKIDKNKIFVFKMENDDDNLILTYNVDPENANIKFNFIWPDTISIHRKKETNTLFSLNALNEIIKKKNNGQLNAQYSIDWTEFENSMLLFRNGQFSVIPITLIKINR